ncbi:two-component system response regulator [Desulfosarcina ovata subsp. sediminis]|uniref:Two-component system response regulator n=1 Tax=Desulfosarcina ovata subsp. sediminis TaxID=885957 RepID=A0A5K7ZWD5_9BACT|nr:EAL domain-containing protein [Desulfosarcina ovata]BBO84577.1 two-component system response regulator [Desulfosarcina ovata subsp. sediminis]
MMMDSDPNPKPKALVVDDDPSLRLFMSAALKKAGFDVLDADGGAVALDLFVAHRPDLILLDLVMPGMDGFETCTTLRKLPGGRYTQILMVTGLDDTDSIERAFDAGANDFVSKPINWTMLGHKGKYLLRAGQAFKELDRSRSRLAKTQELARLGNWQIDLLNAEFSCSSKTCRLLGFDCRHSPTLDDFVSTVIASQRDQAKEKIELAVRHKQSISLNYPVILPDGTQKHILNQGEILFNENGIPELLLGVIQDVTQLKRAEEEIRLLAFYDSLTGLANRALFLDRLEKTIATAKRNQQKFALLFLDLDQFKLINDTLGHHIGDLLLKKVAARLKRNIRDTDTAGLLGSRQASPVIARLGGDEFTVLLDNIGKPEMVAKVATRLIREISDTYHLEGHELSMTTSIGISVFPEDGTEPAMLLKNADSAMYHAKNNGRNSYQFYKAALNRAVLERFSIERDLKRALANDEFVLFYQPQIDLASRRIVGAEALIRWNHPLKGMISPDKFISIAEESGQIIDINRWVIQTACRQKSRWRSDGLPPISTAVNLSGYKLSGQDIIRTLREALDSIDDNEQLEIEITENVLMQDTKETVSTLQGIKDLKLRIALDDFGTGYSSLSYLTTFPVDTIKIDRSFVMGCTAEPNNVIIIRAIIAMGHSMGKRIVAEGIETEEQYRLMTELGCDEGQGYLFKHPVPPDDFAKLLANTVL